MTSCTGRKKYPISKEKISSFTGMVEKSCIEELSDITVNKLMHNYLR